MKQREVIFRTEHRSHQIEVVRVTEVLDSPGRKMKVERSLQAFINGVPLKYEEPEQPGLQRDLVELAQAIAEQLPPRVAPSDFAEAGAVSPETVPSETGAEAAPDDSHSTPF